MMDEVAYRMTQSLHQLIYRIGLRRTVYPNISKSPVIQNTDTVRWTFSAFKLNFQELPVMIEA